MIRLWPRHHLEERALAELMEAFQKNPGCCDEVWFCTAWGFPTLETHRQHALRIASAATRLSELGIQPGLQIANTLGHGLYPLMARDAANWPRMLGHRGEQAATTPCPRSKEFHEYLREMGQIYGTVKPSSVWIDDDLRMSHHQSVSWGCFCGSCLESFSASQGVEYTRAPLVGALHKPGNGALRLAWTRFAGESLGMVASTVAESIHEVSPGSRLAFQQLDHETFLYSGPDWKPVHRPLFQQTGLPTGARLGNGYYCDHQPRQVLTKAFRIARQISRLPASVEQICPEIESFPHNAFGKTPHGLAVESALYLAMGCNSLSYAVICSDHEPITFHKRLLAKISQQRPFWESYLTINDGTLPAGIAVPMGENHAARTVRDDEKLFAWTSLNLDSIYQMAPLGIPFCVPSGIAAANILHEEAIPGFSDGELEEILVRGAMLTGAGAFLIQERGMGALLGVRVSKVEKVEDVFERVTSDPLNGEHAGRQWLLWMDPGAPVYRMEGLGDSVRGLGLYEDSNGNSSGIATSLSENSRGGRVAVFGYFDWARWNEGHLPGPSSARRDQNLAAADWISRNSLPVVVRTPAQVVVIPRVNDVGRLVSLFVLNASIDFTSELECELRGAEGATGQWHAPQQEVVGISTEPVHGGTSCRIPALAPWSFGFLQVSQVQETNP